MPAPFTSRGEPLRRSRRGATPRSDAARSLRQP